MEDRGYKIRYGKYPSFQPRGSQKSFRAKEHGRSMTEDDLRNKWEEIFELPESEYISPADRRMFVPYPKAKGFRALYLSWMYALGMIGKGHYSATPKISKEQLALFKQYKAQQAYYSRNAGTYDTLLQMCRWFGYRPGYEDLCRVYLTQENIDRFDAVLEAIENLKEQFGEMERQGKKPKDFGLMIKESPDTLETTMLITARNKMRGTEQIEIRLNYGGVYADTSKLSKDPRVNKENIESFVRFYESNTDR